jgi:hypothetical protein
MLFQALDKEKLLRKRAFASGKRPFRDVQIACVKKYLKYMHGS